MPERNTPSTKSFTVTGAETVVYESPSAPRDVPVSVFNAGDTIVRVRFGGDDAYIPVQPGHGITANPDPKIYATTDGGTATVIVAQGVRAFASGVSSTGALSAVESQSIAVAHTQKSLLVEILLQAKLQTELLKLAVDTELTVSDFPSWRVPE